MKLIKNIKKMIKGTKYCIDTEVLRSYMNEVINFGKDENLSFCDEFFLMESENAPERLHITILNYDAPCEDALESEKDLYGIIIFVNNGRVHYLKNNEKFYSPEKLIRSKLQGFPEKFILCHELCEPKSLESYKIEERRRDKSKFVKE